MKKYNKKGEYIGVNPFLQETYHAEPEEKFYACFILLFGSTILIIAVILLTLFIQWYKK